MLLEYRAVFVALLLYKKSYGSLNYALLLRMEMK